MAPAIEIEGLTKVYKGLFGRSEVLAVDNLNLRVEQGEIFGLLGPNGAGKTTTIKLLLHLIFPTKGEMRIFGVDVRKAKNRERIGYLPEDPNFHKFLTAEEFLNFHGKLYGMRKNVRKERIKELLKTVDLIEQRRKKLANFSRGMLQRISIAQALINSPDLLLLDEPTADLDPIGKKEIKDLFLRLKEEGKTIFLSSHLLSEIEKVCDRVAILNKGRLIKIGSIDELTKVEKFVEITVSNLNNTITKALQKIVLIVEITGNKVLARIENENIISQILDVIKEKGGKLISLSPKRESLEERFFKIIKGEKGE